RWLRARGRSAITYQAAGPGRRPSSAPRSLVARTHAAPTAASGRNFEGGIVKRFRAVPVLVILLALGVSAPAAAKGADTAPFWSNKMTATSFAKLQDDRLGRARSIVDK